MRVFASVLLIIYGMADLFAGTYERLVVGGMPLVVSAMLAAAFRAGRRRPGEAPAPH